MERQHPSGMYATKNQDAIRRYLLGDPSLSEEQRASIEDAYFGDDVLHATILEMEDELVDAYVFGELSAQERIWFEDGFRQSERRSEKVELARSLVRHASRRAPQAAVTGRFRWLRAFVISAAPPASQLGAACAMVLLLAGSLTWFYTFRAHQGGPRTSPVAVNKPPDAPGVVAPVGPPSLSPGQSDKKAATPAVLSFILVPDLTRGSGEMTSLKIPKGAYSVSLRMDRTSESYARYDAALVTAERRVIASQANLTIRRLGATRTLVFTLRSDFLVPGVYVLSLKGRTAGEAPEDLDDYTFQVVTP